jgi:hypothetical protein
MERIGSFYGVLIFKGHQKRKKHAWPVTKETPLMFKVIGSSHIKNVFKNALVWESN